jgi:ubiquinone biosynthesis protein
MPSLFLSKDEIARAGQILRVIGRYGFAPLAQAIGLGWLFHVFYWRRMERRFAELTPPVRLRLALVELGTTFIKLGQVLSARSDLLPPEYLTELAKLQDEVPPLPFAAMEPVFRHAFGVTPAQAFAEFDPDPIASASIGQAYRGRLNDGDEVVVKIQRPGVERQVRTDLSLLAHVAEFANRIAALQRFDLPALVREFSGILQDELIYTLEAHNAETLAREVAHTPEVGFPRVYWAFTSRHVLTMYLERGVKITDLHALDARGIDRPRLAVHLANSLLRQILLHGMFHGDPHPGNLLVTDAGRIIFLDTGMVGRLDRTMREVLIELAVSIFDQDIDAILGHLQQLGVVDDLTDLQPVRRDLSRLITKYYFLPRRELRLGELLQRMNHLLFQHHIRMAYEFSLLAKALFVAEGIAQELDPQFDYNVAARPVIAEVRKQYYSARTFVEDSVHEWRGLRRALVDLPRRLSAALGHLERGAFRVRNRDEQLDIRQQASNIMVNRVSFTALTIGLLIASALLLTAHGTAAPMWEHYLVYASLIAESIFILVLLVALLRSGRI